MTSPRLEFARIQAAREANDSPLLAQQEANLLKEHEAEWHAPFKKLNASIWFRRGEISRMNVMIASTEQLERLLDLAPKLETLYLNFSNSFKATPPRGLFEVPALQRLDEIAMGGGEPRDTYAKFFASPHTRNVKRISIGASHATDFARQPWPRLERLTLSIDETTSDREALTRILETDMSKLRAVIASAAGRTVIEVLTRSLVFRQLEELQVTPIGDDGIAALANAEGKPARLRLDAETATAPGLARLVDWAGQLAELELNYISTSDAHLRAVAKIPRLRALRFSNGPLSPHALGELMVAVRGSLEDLRLPHQMTAAHCDALSSAEPRRLRALLIGDGAIGPAGATALGSIDTLERLSLDQNRNLGDSVAALSRLSRLRELQLQFCSIRDEGGTAIANWPRDGQLITLNLNGNHICAPHIQTALQARFPWLHEVALLGYQHPIPAVTQPAERPQPKQRPHARLPPRRRDWTKGVSELIGRNHFASWDGHVDAKVIAKCEALIDRCAQAILALGKDADAKAQRAVLKKCIIGLNAFSSSIFTIEAEDIITTFEAIARYTKLATQEDLADEWRDF